MDRRCGVLTGMVTIGMTENIGELVRAYAHAKWADEPDARNIARLGGRLDPVLRERIDTLGLEGEQLLSVEPGEVLVMLEALERQAAEEDARVSGAAARLRADEQQTIERRASGAWFPTDAKARVRPKAVGRRRKRPRQRV